MMCLVYSQDKQHQMRASIMLTSLVKYKTGAHIQFDNNSQLMKAGIRSRLLVYL